LFLVPVFISSQVVISKEKKYVFQSVLADVTSEWYKIAISRDGFYKLSYEDLVSFGISKNAINPTSIHLYGNASGVLPEENDVIIPDDLNQNAVSYYGMLDGTFDPGDYILFYAYGPDRWNYTNGFFQRKLHLYSDQSFYFSFEIEVHARHRPR
jgi:hypothetical protein